MQPHSMCAVALAHYIWNNPDSVTVKDCAMRVEYRDHHDHFRNLYYRISNVRQEKDDREFKMDIVRDGGGVNCVMIISRNSTTEGAEVTIKHDPEHISGLVEIFNLYKNKVSSGRHRNSRKYAGFEGHMKYLDRMTMYCDLVRSNGSTTTSTYNLEIVQTNPPKKSNN
jgi:hypothetical protein